MRSVDLSVTSPAPRRIWQHLVEQGADALVTQTPTWCDCICGTGPYEDVSRLYDFGDGGQVVLPLVRRRNLPAYLASEESWPFDWGIGGPLAAPRTLTTAHARAVFADLARRRVLRVAVRLGPGAAVLWGAAAPSAFSSFDRTTYVLDLDGGFGHIWQYRFHSRVRRAIRKAERLAVDVEVDTTGRLMPVFYRLYEASIARWAREQHEPLALARWRAGRANPLRKFETVAARLGPSCATWMAWRSGEPVAAIVVLRQGRHAKYWRGAMNKELAHPVRANHLLHRLAIEDACAAGCRYYSMGDSRPGSTLAAFKESFGAQELLTRDYRKERLPLSAADHRLRALAKRLIKFQDA